MEAAVRRIPPGEPRARSRSRVVLLACLVLAGVVLPITGEAAACASTHGKPFLSGFAGGANAGSPFYWGPEAGSVQVQIRVTPGHCVDQLGSTTQFQTDPAVAVAGDDYTPVSATSEKLCDDVDTPSYCLQGHNPTQEIQVSIAPGGDPEPAVEPFLFRLFNGNPFGLAEPTSAPIHIIDTNGGQRASLEPTTAGGPMAYQRTEFGHILIPVFLAGPAPSGSVAYSVEPDPAAPATPGEDFTVASPNPLPITNRVAFIQIDIVSDKLGEGNESVVITLQPGAGYTVAEPSSTTFTIIDNEESVFPKSRFHHPRNKWKYNKADYRIREFHIFATDEGGSGVVAAELALRRNLANGKCAWKTKSGWQKKDCQNREWLPTKYDDVGELFYYRMKQLKSSVGTKIKDYTAFARAIDGAGNVEKEFNKKRNMNTFEIKRRGKTQKS
jgi:hypothetical protein